MKIRAAVWLALIAFAAPAFAQAVPPAPAGSSAEVIADIQIHGNNATPDAEILATARIKRGDTFTAATLDDVRKRLEASGRFEGVEIRKRFASISDLSQVSLVIILDEYPVSVSSAGPDESQPRVVRRGFLGRAMFMPILEAEDGYGLTYGLVTAFPDVAAERSRLSVPLSWGGRKRADVEFDQRLPAGPISRVVAGGGIERRKNPAFQQDDDRLRVWGRAERAISRLVIAATAERERVSFGHLEEPWTSIGAAVTFDTRLDPALPRNAVYASASWTHLRGAMSGALGRTSIDVRGYVGLPRQLVVVARAGFETADRGLPPYFKSLLGGWSNLRGYRAGAFVGDTRLNGTLELRVPLSSALSVLKTGVSMFVDTGKAYDRGVSAADVPYARGIGAGAWFAATLFRGGLDVARSRTGDVRVNVGVGVTF